jgi:hypothetical protein
MDPGESLRRAARFAILLCTALAACRGEAAGPDNTSPDTTALVRGVALSPRGFPGSYEQLPAFFDEVRGIPGGGALWNGAWREDLSGGSDAGRIPAAATLTMEQSRSRSITPVIVFGWRAGTTLFLSMPGNARNDWSNGTARAAFRTMLIDFARGQRPPFMFLGNESDFYYEQDPADYRNWLSFYDDAYDAIKAVSPATRVGPVFNFEHLAGRGSLNGWNKAHWEALTLHDLARVDIVGLTLYPFFDAARAANLPDDYLAPLFARIGAKALAITETGWPAETPAGGAPPLWEANEAAQVTLLDRLDAVLRSRDVRLISWLFLHPMQDPGGAPLIWRQFGSISLRNSSGAKRAVYDRWTAFRR